MKLKSVEPCGIWITPSLPLFPGSLCPGVAAPARVMSMGQIELFDIQIECKQNELFEIEL